MFGSEAIDLLIGLTVIYFVFAVMASAFAELISSLLATRSTELKKGIDRILQGQTKDVEDFYAHPLIKSLTPPGSSRFHRGKQLPSYLPPEIFARVYASMLEGGKLGVATVPNAIGEALGATAGNAREYQKALEGWFNATMDRVSGWYKRRIQTVVFIFAVVAVVGANADTISVANSLWQDPTIRDRAVAIAENQDNPDISLGEAVEAREDLAGLSLLGWVPKDSEKVDPREVPDGLDDWLLKIIGLTITIGAVSVGAPFWFDLMSKLLNARSQLADSRVTPGAAGKVPAATVDSLSAVTTDLPPPQPMTEDKPT